MKRAYPVDTVTTSEHSRLKSESRVLLNQIKSIDKQRLGHYVGSLDIPGMDRSFDAILLSLGFVEL